MLDDRYTLNPTTGLSSACPEGAVIGDACVADDLSLRASVGLSVHWKAPVGPIRFDFSKILSSEEYDRTETFRFSTSTQF